MMAGHYFPEKTLSQYVNIAISTKLLREKKKKYGLICEISQYLNSDNYFLQFLANI